VTFWELLKHDFLQVGTAYISTNDVKAPTALVTHIKLNLVVQTLFVSDM